MKESTRKFMESVEERIGNYKQPVYNAIQPDAIYFDAFGDEHDADSNVLPYGDELIDVMPDDVNDAYLEALDNYIGAEVVVPGKDSIPVLAKVKKRKRDAAGIPLGEANSNPILDSRVYELEFPDGRVEEYSVKVIAENLLNQADGDDGIQGSSMRSLISAWIQMWLYPRLMAMLIFPMGIVSLWLPHEDGMSRSDGKTNQQIGLHSHSLRRATLSK